MKRLIVAALALGAVFLGGPTVRPAAAAPAAIGGAIAAQQPLVTQVHSRRWHFIRRHYRPYGYGYRPHYRPYRVYYRPVYRPYGFHRRAYWHRPYWHRRPFYRPAFYGRPYWHRRHHWHRGWHHRRWHRW